MGNYNINIQGMGQHHNGDKDNDANEIAKKIVQELKSKGHIIENASFTFGGKEELKQ